MSAHTLRHSCAMRLLQGGNDVAVIALFLGHEQISTTSIYLNSRELHRTRTKAQVAC
ncbi:MAG: tyrosine-type recombinase/integrase [Sciscionella sp.]